MVNTYIRAHKHWKTHTHLHVLMDRTHMFQPPRPAAAAADLGGEAHTLHKGRAVRLTRRPWTATNKSTFSGGRAFCELAAESSCGPHTHTHRRSCKHISTRSVKGARARTGVSVCSMHRCAGFPDRAGVAQVNASLTSPFHTSASLQCLLLSRTVHSVSYLWELHLLLHVHTMLV